MCGQALCADEIANQFLEQSAYKNTRQGPVKRLDLVLWPPLWRRWFPAAARDLGNS